MIIDMQNVFVTRPVSKNQSDEEKLEAERWESFYREIDMTVIPNNQKLLTFCRRHGIERVFGKIQCLKSNGADWSIDQKATGFNELLLTRNDPAADIIDELKPIEDELVVQKTTDSILTGTNLRLVLYNMGIDTVLVTGVFLDQCVSGSVRSFADESFKVWLIEDAVCSSTREIQNMELSILNNIYCHVITTDEAIEALTKQL